MTGVTESPRKTRFAYRGLIWESRLVRSPPAASGPNDGFGGSLSTLRRPMRRNPVFAWNACGSRSMTSIASLLFKAPSSRWIATLLFRRSASLPWRPFWPAVVESESSQGGSSLILRQVRQRFRNTLPAVIVPTAVAKWWMQSQMENGLLSRCQDVGGA